MAVRIRKFLNTTGTGGESIVSATEYKDNSVENRTTIVDGYEFHWGPNEVRNFLDDGVGLAHAAFQSGDATEDAVIQDTQPFNNARA